MRGRKSIKKPNLARWADDAGMWLRKQFGGKGLDFYTGWCTKNHTITLRVFRSEHRNKEIAHGGNPKLIFEVTEPADVFITPTTLTKIILLIG